MRKIGTGENRDAATLCYGKTLNYFQSKIFFIYFVNFQYYEMSYGLNVEMHKQTEISKRLSALINQLVPFLSQEHQQQVDIFRRFMLDQVLLISCFLSGTISC
jgi:hypothetical protein